MHWGRIQESTLKSLLLLLPLQSMIMVGLHLREIVGGVVGLVDYLGNNLMGQVDEANLQ